VAQDARWPVAQDKVARTIVGHLKANGGSLNRGQRAMAQRLRASRTTVQRAISALAAAGVLVVEATHSGTVLRLC
jgi:DNA-binding GntR family transcriptional regulator